MSMGIIEKILREEGFKVFTAGNGKQVLSIVKEQECDILLLDLEMPVMSGYEVAKHLKQQSDFNVPIVALTAHSTYEAHQWSNTLNLEGFMTKPIDRTLLLDTLSKVTGNKNTLHN